MCVSRPGAGRDGPGRPPLTEGDTPVSVTVVVPSKQYRSLELEAQRERVEIRDLIRRKLRDDE